MNAIICDQNKIPKLIKLKKADILYYLFFIIIEIGEALNKGSSNQIFLTFAGIAMLFLGYKLIHTNYSLREMLFLIILSCFAILIYYNTRKAGGILSIVALTGMKGVDISKLLKLTFYIQLTAFLLLMCLSSFGIIENARLIHLRGEEAVIRYGMGFSHPNQFHLVYIILVLLFMYIYYEKLRTYHILMFGLFNILIYFITYSRTSTFIGFLALFMCVWFKSNYFHKLKNFICISIIPFGILISLIPALLYDKIKNLREIDSLMQWRITFSKHYLDSYPLKLFGNNLNGDSIVLDSGYVELIINYGLIFTFLYVAAYMILILRFTKRSMYRELLLIVCFAFYGVTESFIPNLFVNVSMIFFGELIFYQNKKHVNLGLGASRRHGVSE